MSTPPDLDLKAGHPPAVKAGGMRVARHRKTTEPEEKVDEKVDAATAAADEEEFGVEPEKPDKQSQEVLVSGVTTKGDKDFSPEAVKQFHDKPTPCKEKRPVHATHMIQQPR